MSNENHVMEDLDAIPKENRGKCADMLEYNAEQLSCETDSD